MDRKKGKNLYNKEHKVTDDRYRKNWDLIFKKEGDDETRKRT